MELLIGIIYIGVIIYLANVEEATGEFQALLRPSFIWLGGLGRLCYLQHPCFKWSHL